MKRGAAGVLALAAATLAVSSGWAAQLRRAQDPLALQIGGMTGTPPSSQPLLGYLLGGFVLLVVGLAALTVRGPRPSIQSPAATRRALLYALVYGLCTACFLRVIGPALMGQERSPWLLALGDVLFVTLGLYVWVMVLAEGHPLREYGFHGGATARLPLAVVMGVGAVVVVAFEPYRSLLMGRVIATPDSLVFSALFALAGSALPEEILFRGYLQRSLEGRAQRWARVALPALAFTAIRLLRFPPGMGLGSGPWMVYIFGVVLPLGLWWGLMRELSGGSLWPSLVSHFFLDFGTALASTSPNGS